MGEESRSDSGASPFGGWWLAGILFLLLTLGVWVFFYSEYGEAGELSSSDTTVVALIIALIVFGGRWILVRVSRKRRARQNEASK
jgi:hypothetical protein